MSRSGYPPGNMPSSPTNDAMAMKSTRRDSPVLAHDKTESGTGRLNSPVYPIHFQAAVNTKGATPGNSLFVSSSLNVTCLMFSSIHVNQYRLKPILYIISTQTDTFLAR